MRELVLLVVVEFDLFIFQEVLPLVVEDEMDAAHVVAAKVGAEHNSVLVIAAEFLLVKVRQQLDVATAAEAVIFFFVFDSELNDEWLALKRGRECI